jgi:hypothetical protein
MHPTVLERSEHVAIDSFDVVAVVGDPAKQANQA